MKRLIHHLSNEAQSESAFLLPLRLFIGIGWLRAGLEKLIDPSWSDGSALADFLGSQLASGQVALPFYGSLIARVFLPGVAALGWVVLIGQLLVGASILAGAFTPFGLFWGLFMNTQFILAGQVNPSAFYIIIQVALLYGNADRVLSVDALLARRRAPHGAGPGQAGRHPSSRPARTLTLLTALALLAAAALVFPWIEDFGPHSVDDPAMILFVLSTLACLPTLIAYLRQSRGNAAPSEAGEAGPVGLHQAKKFR